MRRLMFPKGMAPTLMSVGMAAMLGMTVLPGWAQSVGDRQQESASKLEELKARIAESEARKQALEAEQESVASALQDLQQRLVRAAQQIQSTEERVTLLENNVTSLKSEVAESEASLTHRHGQLKVALAAMQRLSRQPPELVFLRPDDSLTTIRSAALLSTVVPELRGRAEAIQMDLEALRTLRTELEAEREDLRAELAELETQRGEMDELIAARRHEQKQLGAEARQEAERLAAYAREARTLEDLLNRLEAEYAKRREIARHAAENLAKRPDIATPDTPAEARPAMRPTPQGAPPAATGRSFASVQGSLPFPARGPVVKTFGQRDALGNASKGIVIETRTDAQVVAPYDGRVVFSGPFRNYGQILIISHGEGYHTLLAGMTRVSGVVGQWVLAGEPIGVMGTDTISGSSNSRSRLYVELRSNGKPVNPLQWLAAGDGKVSG